MNPIHLNKRSSCINIIINLCLIFIMVYVLKTTSKPCPHIKNDIIKKTPCDKSTMQIFPKGDWIYNTQFYSLNGNILCGSIKYSNHFSVDDTYFKYNDDCIMFKKNDIITTHNGKFKIIN